MGAGAILKTTLALSSIGVLILIGTGLFYMLSGQGSRFDIRWFLESTSPHMWAGLGIGFSLSLSVLGAGWYVIHSIVVPLDALKLHISGEFSRRVPQSWVAESKPPESERKISSRSFSVRPLPFSESSWLSSSSEKWG